MKRPWGYETFTPGQGFHSICLVTTYARIGRVLAAVFVFMSAIMPSAAKADVTGRASVIDGDTIEIHDQRIRLHGIDAPESKQTCRRDGETWRCGQQASLALADKIGQQPVRCEEQDRDRYGRIVAKCFVGKQDLSEWLALEGWAVAYVYYSYEYTRAEARAKSDRRRGIWAGEFDYPWEWRKRKRRETVQDSRSPGDCRIKGNISRKGTRIYHVPGGRWYDRTRIDTASGERWFCTEAEARAAGWRRSHQ
jgi:endonuclease YncB( thermonuclease family)